MQTGYIHKSARDIDGEVSNRKTTPDVGERTSKFAWGKRLHYLEMASLISFGVDAGQHYIPSSLVSGQSASWQRASVAAKVTRDAKVWAADRT